QPGQVGARLDRSSVVFVVLRDLANGVVRARGCTSDEGADHNEDHEDQPRGRAVLLPPCIVHEPPPWATPPAPAGPCSADALLASSVGRGTCFGVIVGGCRRVVMVLRVRVAIVFGGALWSALFGSASSDDAERRHEGDPA